MAYVDANNIKQIRAALKKAFPKCGFRARKIHNSTVSVDIIRSPFAFEKFLGGKTRKNVYAYNPETHKELTEEELKFLKEVMDIIKYGSDKKWFDKSDSQTDYFYTAFYIDLDLGNDKNPYKMI